MTIFSEVDSECAWCGGEALDVFINKRLEVFCSPVHRTASNRALRRLLQDQEEASRNKGDQTAR